MVRTHKDVESLQIPFTQHITRFGVTRTFEHSLGRYCVVARQPTFLSLH